MLSGVAKRYNSHPSVRERERLEDDPSSSSSSESQSSGGYYSTTSEDSNKRRQKRKRAQRKQNRRDQQGGNAIKPIPPREYDGTADPRSYHHYVMEGEAYLHDGKVHKEQCIRILAHFLTGKGYDFYMQKVASDNLNHWDVHKFFMELFNYCFPIDYRQQMHVKMENMCQGYNQLVSEYVHKLQEVFSMVGALTPELRVIKLWYSLRAGIQCTMWKDRLHPDTSTWDEIVVKAEVIEIANKVVDPREQRLGNPQSNNCSTQGSKSQGKSSQGLSSQAASLMPNWDNSPNGNTKNNSNRKNQNGRGTGCPNSNARK